MCVYMCCIACSLVAALPTHHTLAGMHMVNDALVQLAHGRARWMSVYLDISSQCIKLLDKDVSALRVVGGQCSSAWCY